MPSLPQKMSQAVKAALFGTPFGYRYPEMPQPTQGAQVAYDARTVALKAVREYLLSIVFYLPPGNTPFQLQKENFPLEQADYVEETRYPSMGFVGGEEQSYEGPGFVPYVLEETVDQFGPGTVLKMEHDHVETLKLEVWGSKEPELRSMLAGLESAFNPTEERAGFQLQLADYFGAPASFTLVKRAGEAQADTAKGRRKATLSIKLQVPVLTLVRYVVHQPVEEVIVNADLQTGQVVNIIPPYPRLPPTDPNAPPPIPPNTEYILPGDAVDTKPGTNLWLPKP